jgi:nucleoside-diphosphate-sugar epimerase
MNILVTSAAAPLAQTLAEGLRTDHTVRLTERVGVNGIPDRQVSPLGPDLSTNLLVRGVDAIVHVAAPLPTDNELQQIDYLTRCTYNLCLAAAAEGVKRVVYLNTLAVMTSYDPTYLVGEFWRPQPPAAARPLAKHLGEATCREFAREFKLEVVSLRLGEIVKSETVSAQPDPMWLDERDAVQAVALALTTPLPRRWAIYHIQHKADNGRFPIGLAEQQLNFHPQYNGAAQSNERGGQ